MPIDELEYEYDDGNKLLNVTDHENDPKGFEDGNKHAQTNVDDFEYDDYGNLIKDRNKGIDEITYNHLNLPKKITFANNNTIEYLYDANGTKLKKVVTESTDITETQYLDGFQYVKPSLGDWKLEFFPHAEGYVKATYITPRPPSTNVTILYNYVYNYTDHLGNIRLRYTADPTTGEIAILEEDHYYPFGLRHKGYNDDHKIIAKTPPGVVEIIPVTPILGDTYKYKFGNKEWQDELDLNYYDFGARNYDPALGRWMNVDPLAEKYHPVSPYNYVLNSPLILIDPDGKQVKAADEKSQEVIMTWLNDQFGEGHGFSFKKNGQLRHRKKDMEKGKELTEEQQLMFDGINEAIDNKDRTVHIKVSEDENINYSESVTLSNGMNLNFSFDMMEKVDGKDKYQAGQTMQMPFDTENAFIIINRKEAKTVTADAVGGGLTNASESSVFIHELLDHGLDLIRTGSIDNSRKSKKQQVKYHNAALKNKGSKTRTGNDH